MIRLQSQDTRSDIPIDANMVRLFRLIRSARAADCTCDGGQEPCARCAEVDGLTEALRACMKLQPGEGGVLLDDGTGPVVNPVAYQRFRMLQAAAQCGPLPALIVLPDDDP
jgi:hypothetical protein